MTRSVVHGKFLVLSKNEINEMFRNEEEYSYKITQIEPSFNDDYIVEVVEKSYGYKITASVYDTFKEEHKKAIEECGEEE